MVTLRLSLLALASLLPAVAPAQSTPVRDNNVEARLVSSVSSIQPGVPFTLGLQLTIDRTWHTYWANPGETGTPTSLKLTLPEGFTAGPLQFPVPKKFITDYGFGLREAGYGYETSVIHPMTITPPATLTPGQKVTLSGTSGWLMCDPGTCVPGKADLSITLDVGAVAAPSPEASSIEAAVAKLPKPVAAPLKVALDGANVVLTATIPAGSVPEGAKLAFHPLKNKILDAFADATVTVAGETVTITGPKHESLATAPAEFSGVLAVELPGKKTGFELSTSGVESASTVAAGTKPDEAPKSDPATDAEPLPFGGGLLGILLAAFIGGIILNIMPCVFPVISLKVMSFVGQAGEDRKKVFAHAAASPSACSSSSGCSRR